MQKAAKRVKPPPALEVCSKVNDEMSCEHTETLGPDARRVLDFPRVKY